MSDHNEPRTVHINQLRIPPENGWSRLPWIGGSAGLIGLLASALLGRSDPAQFYYSWLVAFLFFLSLALGSLFFVLIHFATKSGWGVVVRRLAETTMATLPLFILLFLPIGFGLGELFHWSHSDAVAHDEILKGKRGYLNAPFFFARAAAYLFIWSGWAIFYLRTSRRQDRTGDQGLTRRMITLSGPAILLFALTVTFAAFDWIMSLDPHWYSTMFGVYYFAGCLVGVFAFTTLFAVALERAGFLRNVVTVEHFHDLGKLLFAFTVFWSYIAFAQFFLIWYGNIPEETLWFLHRSEGSWKTISAFLGWGHFAIPFLFLMPRTVKRKRPFLVAGALWMLAMHLMDLHWLVMPVKQSHGFHPTLLDATTLLAVGGFFIATIGVLLRRHALVPIQDPRLVESLSFENV